MARLLADNSQFSVFIGGRTLAKAETICRKLSGRQAKFTAVKLDKYNLTPVFSRYKPDIVVDASGPFNLKRKNPYVVIEACLSAGIHYLDLADGADFVMGIAKYDKAAKNKDLSIISGLSTCPALTGAILKDARQKDWPVETIEAGIAPSPFAGMGLSVIQGIFDYAGNDVTRFENGKKIKTKALTQGRRQTIAPPGALPLRSRIFAFVDCPDLQVFEVQNSWVGAGTKPEILLRLLMIISKLRAALRLPGLSFLARPGHWLMNKLSRGEHRGGLYLKIGDNRSWHIIAEGDDGPFIPSMACAALLTKWASGEVPLPGARPAHEELGLADFEPFFESRDIIYGWREELNMPHEFQKTLSNNFNNLPERVRALHAPDGPQIWQGQAKTQGPSNALGRLAGLIAGVRVKTETVPVQFTVTPSIKGEVWERDFGGRKFKSRLKSGRGKNAFLMMEHFGPLKFALALVIKGDRLYFIPRRWFFLSIPMPQFLLPGGETYETVTDGKFEFNVDLKVPVIGRIAKYQGWLERTE